MPEKSIDMNALLKDAEIKLSGEECALSMGQSTNDAVLKDVQIKLRKEEFASNMEQMLHINDAALKNAQI